MLNVKENNPLPFLIWVLVDEKKEDTLPCPKRFFL